MGNEEPKGSKPRPETVRGLQLRAQHEAARQADLYPLVTFYLETHPNSTIRQIATGVSRSPFEVEGACSSLVRSKNIEMTFRLKVGKKRG
jgi:hypothetical protein